MKLNNNRNQMQNVRKIKNSKMHFIIKFTSSKIKMSILDLIKAWKSIH